MNFLSTKYVLLLFAIRCFCNGTVGSANELPYNLQCLSELPLEQLLKIRRSLLTDAESTIHRDEFGTAEARIGYLMDDSNRTASALPLTSDKIK